MNKYRVNVGSQIHKDQRNATNTAVKGIVDITKVVAVGSVAMGLLGGMRK